MQVVGLAIVKNEEKNIKKSLESYINIVDKIIIIDTGSTDNTIQICKNLGCIVYNYKWNNNFAEARNFALSKVNNDSWVIFLDADECFKYKIEKQMSNNFRKRLTELENNNVDIIKILTYNIDKKTQKILNISYGVKMFRKKENFKYIRPIHEMLDFPKDTICTLLKEYPLIHTGYSSEIRHTKPKRNLDILLENDKKGLSDTKDYYYLTREFLSLKNYEQSKFYLKKFFQQKDYKEIILSMDIGYMIYNFQYQLMCIDNVDDCTKEKFLLNLISNFPISDFYFHLAILYLKTNLYKSETYFYKTIEINNDLSKIDFYNNYSNYEGQIYYNLAKIYFIKNEYDRAFEYIYYACKKEQENRLFLGLLLNILQSCNYKNNIEILYDIYKPSTLNNYEFLVTSLVNTKLHNEFKHFAIKYNTEFNGNNTSVFMAMVLDNQSDQVMEITYNLYRKTKDTYYIFVLMIALFFTNKINYYNKYYNKLDDNNKKIIDYVINKKGISKDLYKQYINIILRLLYFNKKDTINMIDISLIDEDDILRVIVALENICDYNTIILFLEKVMKNRNVKNINIIARYLMALHKTNRRSKILKYIETNKIDLGKYKYLENLYKGVK